MRGLRRCLVVAVVLFGMVQEGHSLVMFSKTGDWPKSWPQELEPLRQSARTVGVATGTQEQMYEIRFADRAEFERVWPAILKVKSVGAPITLHIVKPEGNSTAPWVDHTAPVVQIYAPMNGLSSIPGEDSYIDADGRTDLEKLERFLTDGKVLKCGPPWPEEITGNDGSLPEYVTSVAKNGRLHWVPIEDFADAVGFMHRCRVDIHLIADGEVIDLNRIKLPADTPIVDRRFDE